MQFVILIQCAPTAVGAQTAFQFIQALVEQRSKNHTILSVFFTSDGVYHGSSIANKPLPWKDLKLPCDICHASALARGILPDQNLHPYFTISTLNELTLKLQQADRVISF